jgi:hypothetical protein
MEILKNVFIISARRSGTHLLTDLIVNNFGYDRIDNHKDFDFLSRGNVEDFIREMSKGNRLAWSHAHDFDNMFDKNLDPEQIEKLREIFHQSKILYVYRDIRDVITSYYHRSFNFNAFDSFEDFYHNNNMRDYVSMNNYNGTDDNLVDVLIDQHKNWFSVYLARELIGLDIEVVSFKEIIEDYKKSVIRIGDFLGRAYHLCYCGMKDVRLKSPDDKNPDIIYTANDFRKGCVGDWINTFGNKWGNEIGEKYDDLIGYHVQQHIHMRKLHKHHDPEKKYFQIDSRDWRELERSIDNELNKLGGKFEEASINCEYYIENRYEMCDRMLNDVRYKHKVFFIDNYVIKFLFPCKAALDRKTFNYVIPIASKKNLLTILKTNKRLQTLNVVPRLYYAAIHNGVLVVIQEKINEKDFIYKKYDIGSKINWNWIVEYDIFPDILNMFKTIIENNIIISDIISPHNLAYINNKLICVDLDGISHYDR